MNYMDLMNLNAEKYERELATEAFIDEYFDMISTESKLDFGFMTSTASLESYGVESAIDGGNFGNKFMYYFSKLGNIFTKRQAGFNQAITQMQQINTGKISQGASVIGLNVENATEYARITEAFNPKAGDLDTRKWQNLMNELDDAMSDARWEILRKLWDRFKYGFLAGLSFGTIILFPLGIYFWFKSFVSFLKFIAAIWNVTVADKAEKSIILAKGIELTSTIIVDIVSDIYFRLCTNNPLGIKKMTIADVNKAVYAIVGVLKEFKIKLNMKSPVEYNAKVQAAEIVHTAAMSVYKDKLHMVSPSAIKAVTNGSDALTDKIFQSIEGYNELKVSVEAYRSLAVAAELYFDITNKVLLDLYKM